MEPRRQRNEMERQSVLVWNLFRMRGASLITASVDTLSGSHDVHATATLIYFNYVCLFCKFILFLNNRHIQYFSPSFIISIAAGSSFLFTRPHVIMSSHVVIDHLENHQTKISRVFKTFFYHKRIEGEKKQTMIVFLLGTHTHLSAWWYKSVFRI